MSTAAAWEPAYLETMKRGLFEEKIAAARRILESCALCPRRCEVDRLSGKKGTCGAGRLPAVSSFMPHFGEEAPLVGSRGSGTVFFAHCNLLCLFCQNYDLSHLGRGREVPPERLAVMMLHLQDLGCHNINFVSPTHFVPQILEAVSLACRSGLRVPLVYNTGGYDAPETLRLLDGVVDIYMPDFKFTDRRASEALCRAPDYPEAAAAAILEMHRQVGDLVFDEEGTARRGLLVRHLVLPGGLAGTRRAMTFLAESVSPDTYVNIMDQYHPCGSIPPGSPLNRRLMRHEYEEAVRAALEAGLTRLDGRRQKE